MYDMFNWQTYRSTHFVIYFYDREEPQLQKVASFAESAYDDISRALNFQIPKPINIIYYGTHSEFEQTNTMPRLPAGGHRRVRAADPQPDGPSDRRARRRSLQKLIAHELTHVFQFEILFGGNFIRAVHLGRAAVAHRGHGLLLRQRRGREGQDGPARRRPGGPGPRDRGAADLRLLRLPLRARRLRLHGVGVGQRRRPGLRLRVPRPARAEHRPRPEAHVQRLGGGLRHPLPALPAAAVHQDPHGEGRADRLRRPRSG